MVVFSFYSTARVKVDSASKLEGAIDEERDIVDMARVWYLLAEGD